MDNRKERVIQSEKGTDLDLTPLLQRLRKLNWVITMKSHKALG